MNYMKQVTQMLGLELGEEFYLSGISYKHKITEDGMFICYDEDHKWYKTHFDLSYVLTGKSEINKKPVLDEAEKRYLSNVIKPFRNRVKHIVKFDDFGQEFIYINLENEEISLPYFEPNTMYKGMELGKEYTLEDLGL